MNLSRRRFLQAACAAGPLAACTTMNEPQPFFARHGLPVGLQMYTLGDLPKNDLPGTLKQVAGIGYGSVELAGYLGKTPQQLRAAFDAAGLKCTSAHVGISKGTAEEPKLLDDIARVAADMHVLGATQVMAPALARPDDINLTPIPNEGAKIYGRIAAAMTEDHWKRIAAQLSGIGKKFKSEGIAFGYHNHNMEFVKVGSRTGLDILIEESDPQAVIFQLDIGWAAAGGVDPVAYFGKHSGRFISAHIKDLKPSSTPNTELRMDPTEVGAGKLDWASILPAAYKAGVRKFFVEQEPPFERDRMEAAKIDYTYLSTLKA